MKATRPLPTSRRGKPPRPYTSPKGVGAHADALERLGPHTTGVGCVYMKDLEAVDVAVLESIIARSYATVTAGMYNQRARECGSG